MPERNTLNETVSNTSEATFLNYYLKGRIRPGTKKHVGKNTNLLAKRGYLFYKN